jgi:hypothetical protein
MRKIALLLAALALTAWAANLKLYLKDGSYQLVREYHVETDRVRFYSVERSQWEEIPLALIDLKRTETEEAARSDELAKEAKADADEERAQQQVQQTIRLIPQDPGVYWVEGGQAKVLPLAESTVHTNKGRSILKALAPIPVVSGKGTLELDGLHSKNVFTDPNQEFYIQLAQTERFGMVKLKPKQLKPKGEVRIVENLTFVPVTQDVVEEPDLVDTFQQQLTPDGLYKIWPKEPLPPGEYAVVEYTASKLNMQVWDFAIRAAK